MQETRECSPNYGSGGIGPARSVTYDSESNGAKSVRPASTAVSLVKWDGGGYMLEGLGRS